MLGRDAPTLPMRRRVLGAGLGLLAAAPLVQRAALALEYRPSRDAARIGGVCDGCELIYNGMPATLTASAQIAARDEPGTRLRVRGTLYRPDGHTAAAGVILYVYHTDDNGHYVPPDLHGRGLTPHGRLRGWIQTDADGSYAFDTICPAPYPARDTPAHIHAVIKEPGKNEYYIDNYVFDDDPLLTAARRRERQNFGGSGIVHATHTESGLLIQRDIVLSLNVQNYPPKP